MDKLFIFLNKQLYLREDGDHHRKPTSDITRPTFSEVNITSLFVITFSVEAKRQKHLFFLIKTISSCVFSLKFSEYQLSHNEHGELDSSDSRGHKKDCPSHLPKQRTLE